MNKRGRVKRLGLS